MFGERRVEKFVQRLGSQARLPLGIRLWDGRSFNLADEHEPRVSIVVPSARGLRYLLRPSLANLGTAYVEGHLDVEGRLTDLIEAAWSLSSAALAPAGRLGRVMRAWTHTRKQDQRDIAYHYDVGNDFYALWLDPQMVYSCAYFALGDEDLASAQTAKLDHVLTKLRLAPGERLLDIGCGWGALVIHAALRYGAVAHGITLSEQQCAFARERVRQLGLQDRVTIELRDYRDMPAAARGSYDKVASIGMFEHVGLRHLAEYFGIVRSLLRDGGLALLHGIASTDPGDGETPYGGGEFIHRYVFPHGELVHLGTLLREMQRGGLEACDIESLRRHYARTLMLWADNLEARSEQARVLAGEKRYRIWRVYLAGCARAFEADWISIFQVLACKAGGGALNSLPMSRAWQYLPPKRSDPTSKESAVGADA